MLLGNKSQIFHGVRCIGQAWKFYMKIKIYAGGKVKRSPLYPAVQEYLKRITLWQLQWIECEPKDFQQLHRDKNEHWIVLDTGGQDWSSEEACAHVTSVMDQGRTLCFLIGSSHGFPPHILKEAQNIWSMGRQTWPHLMVRVMLVEQLYRIQQMMRNHPYSFV